MTGTALRTLGILGAAVGCLAACGAPVALPSSSSATASVTSASAAATVATSSAPSALPVAPPTVYTGSGNATVPITKPAGATTVVATITGNASPHNFDVRGLDGGQDHLVTTTAPYSGSTLLDADGGSTTQLRVHAAGPWSITLSDPRSAPVFSSGDTGTGDTVLVHVGEGGIAQLQATGSGPFLVTAYAAGRRDDLVKQTAPWSGIVRWPSGIALVAVRAVGPWSIAIGHRP